MLASDLSNPEFVGARNPDHGLFVEFYWHEPVDAWASKEQSQQQQKKVVVKLAKQIYCRTMVPGDKQTIWEEPCRPHHQQRFPREWMAWQIAEGIIGGEGEIPGWKLSEWPELTEDQVRELMYLRFQTVEQVAGANDKQIQGMGMGGLALREKAKAALKNRMGAETVAALEAKDKEMAELKANMAAMQEQMQALLAAQGGKRETIKLKGEA